MSDELKQLLSRADASAPTPTILVDRLPSRIRRTARNQRRLAACGLAILFLSIVTSVLIFLPHARRQITGSEIPSLKSQAPQPSPTDLAQAIALHERTAQLLESWERRPTPKIDPTDAFLVNLAAQRNQTALLMLHDADHLLSADHRDGAVATLRKAVMLFPDTPAASRATKQLEQLDLRSQS